MSKNSSRARHRAIDIHTSPLSSASQALSAKARRIGLSAAVLTAVPALMLGAGVSAQASATSNDSAAANTAAASTPFTVTPAAAPASGYTVQSGDTIGGIAAKHAVSLDSVLSLNGLGMNSIIYPGDVIAISGADNAPAAPTANTSVGYLAAAAAPLPAPAEAPAPNVSTGGSVTLASSNVTELPATSTNAAVLASANAQLGAVQDCTVLGEQALRAAGISGVGDESPASLMNYATPVSTPQPGDFIFYADGGMGFAHNAVYIGNGEAIHSGWNGNQTVVTSVNVGSGPSYYRVGA